MAKVIEYYKPDNKFFDIAEQLDWCEMSGYMRLCVIFPSLKLRDTFKYFYVDPLDKVYSDNILLLALSPFGYNTEFVIKHSIEFNPIRIYMMDFNVDRLPEHHNELLFKAFDDRLIIYTTRKVK